MVLHPRIFDGKIVGEGVGIVHQRVDAAPFRDRPVHGQRRMIAVAGQRFQGDRGAAGGCDPGDHRVQFGLSAAGDDDLRPFGGTAYGDRLADALARAGDDHHLAG